jgi:Chalcone isomerase-like
MTFTMDAKFSPRRSSLCLLLWVAGSVGVTGWASGSHASGGHVVFEGQRFDRFVAVAGMTLQLNGTGVRQVAWFKGYLAALYLPAPARTADEAVRMAGAKRIQLRLLQDVPAAELAKALRKGVLRNVPTQEQATLSERLDRWLREIDAMGRMAKGDEINLDFVPGTGLHLYVNAAMRGSVIPGEDFYGAVLRSFVGQRPYDERMREGLLGLRT